MAGTVRGMALRLRQVVLVAPELGPALEEVREGLGIEPCFHDPGVAEFGLENVLFPIGDQFLEIVAPVQEGTTPAGCWSAAVAPAATWSSCSATTWTAAGPAWPISAFVSSGRETSPTFGVRTSHPKDVGGAIVSIDEASPWESWRWAGPSGGTASGRTR